MFTFGDAFVCAWRSVYLLATRDEGRAPDGCEINNPVIFGERGRLKMSQRANRVNYTHHSPS
jgi:hypothetical protein